MNIDNINVNELPLSFKPVSSSSDDTIKFEAISGNKMRVTYVTHDDTPEAPLGAGINGAVYTAFRFSDTHGEMQEALALDSDWNRDVSLVEKPGFKSRLIELWLEQAHTDQEVIDACLEWNNLRQVPECKEDFENLLTEIFDTYDALIYTSSYENATNELWIELIAQRRIGHPFAVLLDCYSHSATNWYISGSKGGCLFDTAHGAGVWVPSEHMQEEMEDAATVLSYGRIDSTTTPDRAEKFLATWCPEGSDATVRAPATFDSFFSALEWLEKMKDVNDPDEMHVISHDVLAQAKTQIAQVYAKPGVELYNQYINGECYGLVTEVVGRSSESDAWSSQGHASTWGYFGLESAVENIANQMSCGLTAL